MSPPLLPTELQIIAVSILLAFVVLVAWLVRRQRLSLRDSLLWLLSTIVALVLMTFPVLLTGLAKALGFQVASNMLFAIALLYALANLLIISIAISDHAVRVRRLVQECALLRGELDALRVRLDGTPKPGVHA